MELLPIFSLFFEDIKEYYNHTRMYLIREHRQFLEDLEKYVHLKAFGNAMSHSLTTSVIQLKNRIVKS